MTGAVAGNDLPFSDKPIPPASLSITIAAGGSSGAFTIDPEAVTKDTTVTLTATWRSSAASAEVVLRPPPSLLAPDDGASFAKGAPITFDWTFEGPGNEIQVSKSATFATTAFDQFIYGGDEASELTTSSLPTGTLYWRVRAYDANFNPGPWSATRSVSVVP
jgi:hypothetical protein